jgi:hypothetical protein
MVAAPTTLAIIALVVSSATRPLEPELTLVLAAALPLALLSPVPLLFSARRTRAAAGVLALLGSASLLELLALELGRRGFQRAALLETPAMLFDLGAAALALTQASGVWKRWALALAAFALLAVTPALLARNGSSPGALGHEIFLYRSLEALREPTLASSGFSQQALALVPFAGALVLFVMSFRGGELSVALALGLLARTGPGTPIASLLGAGASLLAIRVFYVSFRKGRLGGVRPGEPRPSSS